MGEILGATALLWDFGNTLADESWMLAPMDDAPGWPHAYRDVCAGPLGDRWNTGRASTLDVANELAKRLSIGSDRVHEHMKHCSSNVRIYGRVLDYVRRSPLPRVLVTINPDIFSEVIVPKYQLQGIFDHIVSSWEEGTDRKAELCEIAAARLGHTHDGCLLVDNIERNVTDWRDRGGRGYWFIGEQQFAEDFAQRP